MELFNRSKESSNCIAGQGRGIQGVIVPVKNAREAAVVGGLDVYGMENLCD